MTQINDERTQYLNAVSASEERILQALENNAPSIVTEESTSDLKQSKQAVNYMTNDGVILKILKLLKESKKIKRIQKIIVVERIITMEKLIRTEMETTKQQQC